VRLVILGAGGYGRTIMDIASQSGKYREIFFLDDKAERKDVIVRLCDFTKFKGDDTEFYPAIGNIVCAANG
jgi:UDP-N-acetylbacillosamine N-acetyltransferase